MTQKSDEQYEDPAGFVPGFDQQPTAEMPEPRRKRQKPQKEPKTKVKKTPRINLGDVISKIRSRDRKQPRPKKGGTMSATQPIRPYKDARAPRQTPKVVKHSYRVAGGWLRAIQPVNAVIVIVALVSVITMLHGWGHMSLHGVGVGLLFSVIELSLFSLVLRLLDASAKKPALVYAAVTVVVVMLAVPAGVIVKLHADIFSVIVVFAFVVAIADPVGFVNAKVSLQAEREEFDAEKQAWYFERDAQNGIIGDKLQAATELLTAAHVAEQRHALKDQRLETEKEERLQAELGRYATQIKGAVEQTLGVVAAKEAAEKAEAEYTAARQQFNLSHEQHLAQARQEARQEVAEEMDAMQRQIAQGRYIPPTEPSSQEEPSAAAYTTVDPSGQPTHDPYRQ